MASGRDLRSAWALYPRRLSLLRRIDADRDGADGAARAAWFFGARTGPVSGRVAITLGDATLASAAGLAIAAQAAAQLATLTGSGVATLTLRATCTGELAPAELSAIGELAGREAQLDVTLDAATATGMARLSIVGTASTTLGDALSAGAGAAAIGGALAVELGAVECAAAGRLEIIAYAAVVLGDVAAGTDARLSIMGAHAGLLDDAICAADARLRVHAIAAGLLDGALLSAAGTQIDMLSDTALDAIAAAVWAQTLPQGAPPAYSAGRRKCLPHELAAIAHRVWARSTAP